MCPEQVKSLLPGTQQSFGCGLTTRRSQVQILPPPLKKYQVRGPFRKTEGASAVFGPRELWYMRAAEPVHVPRLLGDPPGQRLGFGQCARRSSMENAAYIRD